MQFTVNGCQLPPSLVLHCSIVEGVRPQLTSYARIEESLQSQDVTIVEGGWLHGVMEFPCRQNEALTVVDITTMLMCCVLPWCSSNFSCL